MVDRDGLYVYVSVAGGITFRYDYRFNGRREALTIGRYGVGGMGLAKAREELAHAKDLLAQGVSPMSEKWRAKHKTKGVLSFGDFAVQYIEQADLFKTKTKFRITDVIEQGSVLEIRLKEVE